MKSKLEHYEDILKALADEPLTIDAIAYQSNMDCVNLTQRLKFLIENDMVQERNYEKKTLYAITARGLAIYNTLNLTKRLEKLQTIVKFMDREVQTVPNISKPHNGKPEKNESY
jgi:predicted transcriptional regulator